MKSVINAMILYNVRERKTEIKKVKKKLNELTWCGMLRCRIASHEFVNIDPNKATLSEQQV